MDPHPGHGPLAGPSARWPSTIDAAQTRARACWSSLSSRRRSRPARRPPARPSASGSAVAPCRSRGCRTSTDPRAGSCVVDARARSSRPRSVRVTPRNVDVAAHLVAAVASPSAPCSVSRRRSSETAGRRCGCCSSRSSSRLPDESRSTGSDKLPAGGRAEVDRARRRRQHVEVEAALEPVGLGVDGVQARAGVDPHPRPLGDDPVAGHDATSSGAGGSGDRVDRTRTHRPRSRATGRSPWRRLR